MDTIQNRRRFSEKLWTRINASFQDHEDGSISVDDDLLKETERQGKLLRKRGDRLIFFPDGVEVNGVPLELSGNLFHIMQCFRFADRVSEEAIAEAVWGNKLKNREAIRTAFSRLKRITKQSPFNITFSYDTGFWEILY